MLACHAQAMFGFVTDSNFTHTHTPTHPHTLTHTDSQRYTNIHRCRINP